jgi:membrane protease subunit HflC
MKIFKIALLIVLIIIAMDGFYVLGETNQVIITQFGKPVGQAIKNSGLHFKIPFIQTVHYFEKRILEWDGDPKQIPTLDKKYIWVDTFARWRITDPLKFYQTNRNEIFAHSRLDDIIDGTTRDILSENYLIQVVRSSNRKMSFSSDNTRIDSLDMQKFFLGRKAIQDSIAHIVKPALTQYGMELVDFKIKRVNYVSEVRQKVYERMISERKKIAAKYRSEGQGKAAEIIGKMQRKLDQIESQAYRKSQEIIGKADAKATEIYADAYNRDPDFYTFIKSLETYKKTMDKKSTLIIGTESDYYKYLKKIK